MTTAHEQAAKIAANRRADHVRALEEEREGYVRRGLDDRVALVDAQLEVARKAVRARQEPAKATAAPSAPPKAPEPSTAPDSGSQTPEKAAAPAKKAPAKRAPAKKAPAKKSTAKKK